MGSPTVRGGEVVLIKDKYGILDDAVQRLRSDDWPANKTRVRTLSNVAEGLAEPN
jgi:hypothetical protein